MKKLLDSSKEAVWNYAQEIAKEYELILHSAPQIEHDKTVCGVGYCSDNSLPSFYTDERGMRRQTPFYRAWVNMMNRAYILADGYYKSYEGITVCEAWHDRAVFTKWMKTREWNGCELDKDLLEPGNKVYSPHTCCFIPALINNVIKHTIDKAAPVGVYSLKSGNGYEVWMNNEKRSSHITQDEAQRNWLYYKAELIEPLICNANVRIQEALTRLVEDMRAEAKELDDKQNLFAQEVTE